MPSTTRPAGKDDTTFGIVLVLVIVGLLGLVNACEDPGGLGDADVAPSTVTMPRLRGLETVYAWGELEDAGVDWVEDSGPDGIFHDLSYLHREVDSPWDWKVWSTVPAPGTELKTGDKITVFALEKREFAFFKRNPRMPETGWEFQQPIGGWWGNRMDDIVSLAEERYVPKLAPRDARREPDPAGLPTSGLARKQDPSVEPRLERYLRNQLKEADDYGQFMGTIPHAGQRLRPGQSIVVLFRPDPGFYPEVYGLPDPYEQDWDVYVDTDDDDDDWNVPGWLCPTRFC